MSPKRGRILKREREKYTSSAIKVKIEKEETRPQVIRLAFL